MGNKYGGKAQFFFQIIEQVEHLGLNAHVKGGHGFVANNKGRAQRQCPGDHDTLSLATRKLVRVTVEMLRPEIHFFQ